MAVNSHKSVFCLSLSAEIGLSPYTADNKLKQKCYYFPFFSCVLVLVNKNHQGAGYFVFLRLSETLLKLHTCCRFGPRISSEHLSSTFVYTTATGTAPAGLLRVWDSGIGILSFQNLPENLPRTEI